MARNPHGTPVWYELSASDSDKAQGFYEKVIGWSARPAGMSDMDYRLFAAPDGKDVAGLMRPPEGMSMSGWLVYFGVDDVDATADAVTAGGGGVHMPPTALPGVGRMAYVTDPQGNPFYLMRGEPDEPSEAFSQYMDGAPPPPGHAVWNELTADDQEAAMGFYGPILHLRHEGGMPMGELGDYKFVHVGSTCIGATMNAQPDWPRGWQPYFLVDDIDAALDRISAAGGTILSGPDEIPGGSYSLSATDPEGSRFGLVGPRREGVS